MSNLLFHMFLTFYDCQGYLVIKLENYQLKLGPLRSPKLHKQLTRSWTFQINSELQNKYRSLIFN